MSTFDLVVVGCGGGPNEHNLSSYLLKPSEKTWSEGIVALEAGSGIGALTRILERTPDIFDQAGRDHELLKPHAPAEVLSWIRCYLISHAHMDHINSLVLCAGSLAGTTRSVYAVQQTLKDIEQVFSDRLWPNLASWDGSNGTSLIYKQLQLDGRYEQISDGISVRTMPLSHGRMRNKVTYESAAFFLRHDASNKELLFFGDVEPDTISRRGWNRDIWRAAAQKIPYTLSTIFIECSYPSGRLADRLYGHMSPEHLISELISLADEVVKVRRAVKGGEQPVARKKQRLEVDSAEERRNALSGLHVYIIHCKEDLGQQLDKPVHRVIEEQVTKLVQTEQLGAKIIAAEQGMLIHI
ncbi:cyclic-AMP phosphodiesterase [Irpex rosettiformis]|uniref:Cyclic-AMP phosphodiesterase n=1 Tax=Irpex rosettiformis TaxID=378272 RepID=A0ACB8TTQ2_9APHY|nr:cyclic-AMP phosphodiesterase [Irpex rosettiformis]